MRKEGRKGGKKRGKRRKVTEGGREGGDTAVDNHLTKQTENKEKAGSVEPWLREAQSVRNPQNH